MLIETLRRRVAEREVASASPQTKVLLAPPPAVGSEVGASLKGLDQFLKEQKKGAYAPFVAAFRPVAEVNRNLHP